MEKHGFPKIEDFRRANEREMESLYAAVFERIDNTESSLRAFEDLRPDRAKTLSRVRERFLRYPDPERRPPLFCVPVGVKGIFRTHGERIRAGSLLPADLFDGEEARVVTALREQGAIILGITATTEFAFAAPGPTCNPRNPAHTPGGSSSGSAAGVAAGYFPLALGTQTIGSIVRPASYCGVTGVKPSHGLLPTEGLVFFSRSVDHVGIFASGPAEAESCLDAIAPGFVPAPPPERLCLGVPKGPYLAQARRHVADMVETVLAGLSPSLPIKVKSVPCLEDIEEINALHRDLIAAEFAKEHEEWFPRFRQLYRPQTHDCILAGQSAGEEAIEKGRASMKRLRDALMRRFADAGVDALVCPSTVGEADRTLMSTGDPVMNLPWTHAGLPVVSLPMGTGEAGLPLGMQLVGPYGGDAPLLALAKAIHERL